MPETYNSEKTVELNSVLNEKLRKDAKVLRELEQANAGDDAIAAKNANFSALFTAFSLTLLATRQCQFDFEYRDDKSGTTATPT